MKKTIFYVGSLVVGLALFIGVILHVGFDNVWRTLNYFSISKWFVILLLNAVQFSLMLYRWKIILWSQGHHVRFGQLIGSKLVGFTADYLAPASNVGGEAIRAYVLKRDTGVPFSRGLASIIIDKIIDFSYALPFVLFGIFYMLVHFSLSGRLIAVLLVISLAFIFLLGFFYYQVVYKKKAFFSSIIRFVQLHRLSFIAKAMNKIGEFEEIIIKFFQHDRKTFYRCLWISFLGGCLGIAGFWLIIYFLGIQASVLDALLIGILSILTFLVPIPGSFGSTETGLVLVFVMLGFQADQGVAFTLIFRSVDFIKIGFGLLYFSHFGLKIGQAFIGGQGIKGNGDGPTAMDAGSKH